MSEKIAYPNKNYDVELYVVEIGPDSFRVWATAHESMQPKTIHRLMGQVAKKHAKVKGASASRVSGPGGQYGDKPKDINAVYYYER